MVKKAFKIKKPPEKKYSKVAIGFDISPSCIAGCVKARDNILGEILGPKWIIQRWPKDTPDFEKLKFCANAHDVVHDLLWKLPKGFVVRDLNDLHIAIEELPARVMQAKRYREQSAIIGAFVGGLLRWGYPNIHMVNPKQWQALTAADFDQKANKDWDKWKVKEWAREIHDAPKWPDLIRNSKLGLIPKPKGSKAMPEQPDDRYDATGIMEWGWERAHE